LQKLNFDVQTDDDQGRSGIISPDDVQLIRQSKLKTRYSELSAEEQAAYNRVHENLERLGTIVRDSLDQPSSYGIKLTSGFHPKSGVRGSVPKDLWFAVSNQRNSDVWVGMPQLFMIVSERGIEYGFAASIHPSDFSVPAIKQRVRAAAPGIFKKLPPPGSSPASKLQSDLYENWPVVSAKEDPARAEHPRFFIAR
jgi:hypothetical protein